MIMKKQIITIIILLFLSSIVIISCNKDELKQERNIDIKKDALKFLPQYPTNSDEVFFIDSICQYEQLQKIEFNGFEINYVRTFNSMMLLPCFPEVDTVSLGNLESGNYTLYYFRIDKSDFVQDPIYRVDTLYFVVQ
jgi:hypothetical protein